MGSLSELQKLRLRYKPVLPNILRRPFAGICPRPAPSPKTQSPGALQEMFKHMYGKSTVMFAAGKKPALNRAPVKVGVVLSGGQSAGGHNVISGLFDALKKANPKNRLFGFLGGPSGIIEGKFREITRELLVGYRNTGGFDIIQSGRTKIETPEQFRKSSDTLLKNGIHALVVVGGDDSNTNAALLGEYFLSQGLPLQVIGVPKTIDGDLKNEQVEVSFGFDTAVRTYSEMVGNICRDVNSARKYWHFIRLMGRSASHITLEAAFQTHPNIALIGEEVLAKKQTLAQVVDSMADIICRRAAAGKKFGVALVPEGLIEFIPEIKELIRELNDILARHESEMSSLDTLRKKEFICTKLTPEKASLMRSLPDGIAGQLILDRDPHGNVKVSQIETEKLLIEMLEKRLAEMKKDGAYKGGFATITHFFGYEGRCGFPSNFDANYTYALGYTATLLILSGLTGYMSSVRNLTRPPKDWSAGGVPLTGMMTIERRKGEDKPVIRKALVELDGRPFKEFVKARNSWAMDDDYVYPGPIQYSGPSAIADAVTWTLRYERS